MLTARAWKEYYRHERSVLGEGGLAALLDRAPPVDLPAMGALVFPHTRLAASGELPAAAALAVLRSGRDEVLALGVLHGAREEDAGSVAAARAGDAAARALLRRVHGPGAPGDDGRWTEEFSLDGFSALLDLAARRAGRRPPRVIARFPFLAGENPWDLPGLEELRAHLARGAALVATADPIHHGAGYGMPPADRQDPADERTRARARASIEAGLDHLAGLDFAAFLRHAAVDRSDFRDAGPALAALLAPDRQPLSAHLLELNLVDYADALQAERPTWVAGALVRVARREPASAREDG